VSDENKDGIRAAIRIMRARNVEEAKEIVNRRKITHIVLLSWTRSSMTLSALPTVKPKAPSSIN